MRQRLDSGARKGWGGNVGDLKLDLQNPTPFVTLLQARLLELEPAFRALGVFDAEDCPVESSSLPGNVRLALGIDKLDQDKVNQWLAVLPIVLDKDNDPQAATCPPNVDSALFKRLLAITHLLRTAEQYPLGNLRTDLDTGLSNAQSYTDKAVKAMGENHKKEWEKVTVALSVAQNYIDALKQVFPTLAPCGPKKIIKPNLVVAHKGWR